MKTLEPLDFELRKYFENNILWLYTNFREPKIENRKVLTPTNEDFPIEWNNSKENAFEALKIICKNFQINAAEIELDFFETGMREINTGSSILFMESDPDFPEPGGLYYDKNEEGKFPIHIQKVLLEKPEELIATIAHELAHVKLLGELKLEENDEMLTDLTTVFFGLGIFNANTAFQFSNQMESWGYSYAGYLKIEEWSYCLALFTFLRNEDNPEWKKHLNKNVIYDFERALTYLIENEEEIFKFEEEE